MTTDNVIFVPFDSAEQYKVFCVHKDGYEFRSVQDVIDICAMSTEFGEISLKPSVVKAIIKKFNRYFTYE